jgi:uncharacterized membrane protein
MAATYNRIALASLLAMLALGITWELWLAPLRPGGSWLVLKVLPLLAPLPGLLRALRYTHQWCSMLALAYLGEGLVRATSDAGLSSLLAAIETALALGLFASCVLFARATRSGGCRSAH